MAQITATFDTYLKKEPIDSKRLPDNQKVFVPKSKTYNITEATDLNSGLNHVQVALSHNAGVWYIYRPHWSGLDALKAPVGIKYPSDVMGPTRTPYDFGFKQGDFHLIANDVSEELTAFNYDGKLLFKIPCLCRGQLSDYTFSQYSSDTPPGIYELGVIYRDYETSGKDKAIYSRDRMAYGWYSIDMVSLDKAEDRAGRSGIMIHGGGSACGWPGAWLAYQTLYPTLGCVRVHNADLRDKIVPLYDKKTRIFISVLQEKGSK